MKSSVAAALLGLSSAAYAQYVTQSQGAISYSVSVPDQTASSKSGDIYIQISGPSSNSWIGLGQGSSMSGANIFVIYASSSGSNVTLSPRTGSGHVEPTYNSGAQVTLLEGSGISNGVMTANIKCSDCTSKVDVTSSSSSWIYAARSGGGINSDSPSASISQHSSTYGTMSIDLTKAKNSANTNPFTSGAASGGSSGSGSGSSGCQQGASNGGTGTTNGGSSPTSGGYGWPFGGGSFPTGDDNGGRRGPPWATGGGNNKRAEATSSACPGGNSGSGNLNQFESFSPEKQKMMLMAHGILACLAFAIFFPFGAISIRLMSFPGLIWFHAAFQAFAYLTYIAAFGLGVYMATQLRYMNAYHPIIGILLFVLIFFQPILGMLHHSNFKKFQERTMWSYGHIWLGRIIITLGIINGGLGFLLAANTAYGPIVYGIIAAIVWLIYVASIFIGEKRRSRNARNGPPKYEEAIASPAGSSPVREGAPREFYGRRK